MPSICFRVRISLGCLFGWQTRGNTIPDIKRVAGLIHFGSVRLSLGCLLRCQWPALTTVKVSLWEDDNIAFWFDNLSKANTANIFNKTLRNNDRIMSSNLQIRTQNPCLWLDGRFLIKSEGMTFRNLTATRWAIKTKPYYVLMFGFR